MCLLPLVTPMMALMILSHAEVVTVKP